MQSKYAAIAWAIVGLVAPFVLTPILIRMGLMVSIFHVWIFLIPICGLLAFLSFRRS